MSKYGKGDCRFNPPKNRPKQLFSPFGGYVKDSIFSGLNRHDRRNLMAHFRKEYGKAAFVEAKQGEKKTGDVGAIKAYLLKRLEKEDAKKVFTGLIKEI